ncbi:tellurite-resistance/dicarboxylate transporter family protein [Aspergillus homomorphus CBS 101889]|uniref:C4-dicarboxylate transporter/malic acid transport protein n=1 Tax=Aspergillus homomorphus (strain CBS 101889) TaxID=1450537 RepID=A0A395HNB0_ASPHC|nr:hypothetical protein BO97DRAFT_170615 [Aspergillus homomorphus CBS 101889]RAL09250.1 hypothetical protein BO97DRAFT_170615 [Aspergillus homomorphus CBS 101889]
MLEQYPPPGTSCSDLTTYHHELKTSKYSSSNHVSLRDRLRHFTWAWYTLTMSTGGLALLLVSQPYSFPGLKEIGLAVYIINLAFFALLGSLMATRFIFHGNFLDSLRHDREGLFFPTFWLSIATIITGLYRYFGDTTQPAFIYALEVLFWLYCAFTLTTAVVQYSFVFTAHHYPLQTMMPSWILPAFPIMLSGTIASVIAEQQPPRAAIPMIVAGTTFQGLGFSISFLMYAHYIGRLMETGLPSREHRPGMFICVGPPAFTALALIGMTNGLPKDLEVLQNQHPFQDAHILQLLAIATGAFLWALSLWFFSIAVIATIRLPPTAFHLNWWAMVFPNTGFTLATITLGKSFDSPGVKGVGSAMSICIVGMWLFVFVSNIRAVVKREIVFPGKDEDVSE